MTAINQTIDQLCEMKLTGLKEALTKQLEDISYDNLSFEERIGHLVQAELITRKNRKTLRLQKNAKMKYKNAMLTDVNFAPRRNLNRTAVMGLRNLEWINRNRNIIITGATGTGKTWLACAFTNFAVINGYSACFMRINQLLLEITASRIDGTYLSYLKKIGKFNILILDDLGISPLSSQDELELLEIIEDRVLKGSLIITAQVPVKDWYGFFKIRTSLTLFSIE